MKTWSKLAATALVSFGLMAGSMAGEALAAGKTTAKVVTCDKAGKPCKKANKACKAENCIPAAKKAADPPTPSK